MTYGSESDKFDSRTNLIFLNASAKSMSCTSYSLPSRLEVRKQDVQVGQFHTLGHNTMYPFEWFWQNAQCISQNRSGKRTHRLPSQNVTYESESDQFDIAGGVACSSGEIFVLSVRDVKMGLGVMELLGETKIDDIDLIPRFPMPIRKLSGLILQ